MEAIPDRPISLEVFADEFDEMETQAREISTWGPNVNVKIPVTNTAGQSSAPLIKRLSEDGIVLNITAIFNLEQVKEVKDALSVDTPAIVSVFAGRIADTGVDPLPIMVNCIDVLNSRPKAELLWASPRELLNVYHAEEAGCHIITATNDILGKLSLIGKDLNEYSLETVSIFYHDAAEAGYSISTTDRMV